MQPCVMWDKSMDRNGYGLRRFQGVLMPAHRAAWIERFGSIAPGLEIHHLCGMRACVNVDHMILTTRTQHRQRHELAQCKRGHYFTEENTARRNGRRICRACDRERKRAVRKAA